jgi:hypothetical protein
MACLPWFPLFLIILADDLSCITLRAWGGSHDPGRPVLD